MRKRSMAEAQSYVNRVHALAVAAEKLAARAQRHRLTQRLGVRLVVTAALLRGQALQKAMNGTDWGQGGTFFIPAGIHAMKGSVSLPAVGEDSPKVTISAGHGGLMVSDHWAAAEPVSGESLIRDAGPPGDCICGYLYDRDGAIRFRDQPKSECTADHGPVRPGEPWGNTQYE